MANPISWLLLGRYALLIALTELIPVPLLDRGVETYLRRRMVRRIARRHGSELPEEAVHILADGPSGGCMGCFWAIVCWPVKKLLKTIAFVLQVKTIADTFSEMLHRGLLLEEAFDAGWLPKEPERVRVAMDTALAKIDTRLVERAIGGTFQDHKHELNLVVHEATQLARARVDAKEALGDAADEGLSEVGEGMSAALTASLRATGVVPELIQWFRAEMGAPPQLPQRVELGVITPAEVLPADPSPTTPSPSSPTPATEVRGPEIEEAREVQPQPQDPADDT